MVYLFSIAAAFTSALAGVMQRLGLESVPAEKAMRLGLLTHALRRGVWVAGFGLLLGTFVLQATALRFGQLSVVQPILTVDLLFVIGILSVFFHHRLSWREWAGAGAIVVGLAGFLALADPAVGRGIPGSKAWAAVTAVVVVAAVALVIGARRGPRWWRAAAFGAAAAVLFAYNASLTKATTTLITQGWSHVFTHWEPYAIGVTGLVGFFLLQNALARRTDRRVTGDVGHGQPVGQHRHRHHRLRRAPPDRQWLRGRRGRRPARPLRRRVRARPVTDGHRYGRERRVR